MECPYRKNDMLDCPTRQTVEGRPLSSMEILEELDRVYCHNHVNDCPTYRFLDRLKRVDVLKNLKIPYDEATRRA